MVGDVTISCPTIVEYGTLIGPPNGDGFSRSSEVLLKLVTSDVFANLGLVTNSSFLPEEIPLASG